MVNCNGNEDGNRTGGHWETRRRQVFIYLFFIFWLNTQQSREVITSTLKLLLSHLKI